jgi:fumarylacetoacetate (FAA) hydrolase
VKLATLKDGGRDGGRDGTLVVVDRSLQRFLRADPIAPTLQAALDNWRVTAPLLDGLYQSLEADEDTAAEPFDPAACAAPLPRAYQFADASAYLNHVELARRARGGEMPPSLREDPLMYQGLSDSFLGPRDDITVADESWGIDLEAEIAVVLDDTPMGVPADEAGAFIRLVMLCNDVSLRNLVPNEVAKGFGFLHSKPASAFSPVAVTPEALGSAWDGERLSLPVACAVNGHEIGRPNAGVDMHFGFPELIAHAARTRRLTAGTILASGTVSNRDRATGSACLAELRMIETLENGAPETSFLRFDDTIRIEMTEPEGGPIFGAIEQRVAAYRLA